MPAPKRPNTIPAARAATAKRVRAGQDTMAAKLREAGWLPLAPEQLAIREAAAPEDQRFHDYAMQRLRAALCESSDTEVLGSVQLALMALTMHYGGPETIVLTVADVLEEVARPEPQCICPPDLVARGGFRSGCPVHHLT